MPKKFLIFDMWGDYAHFKKYYTTSSPLTFSIPPRTALIGFISGIIGKRKEEYLEIMTKQKAEIAVRIIEPIKKIRITENLIDTKGNYWRPVKRGNLTGRTQIRLELLKNPKFRIYFRHRDSDIYNSLKENLKNHKSIYTPCLGISELIANFAFISETSISERVSNAIFEEIDTVVPLDNVIKLDLLQPGKKYFKERIPVEMLPGRIVTEYREVLYEIEGRKIRAKTKDALRLTNGDVITPL
jgi:CRISPR-associated protein Cas5h